MPFKTESCFCRQDAHRASPRLPEAKGVEAAGIASEWVARPGQLEAAVTSVSDKLVDEDAVLDFGVKIVSVSACFGCWDFGRPG